MEDATSLFKFEENDLYIPMITLAELDNHKKGREEINRQARATSRYVDTLTGNGANLDEGLPLSGCGHSAAQGKLFLQTGILALSELPLPNLPGQSNDNEIIAVTHYLKKTREEYADVVLVSKDINVRIKARAVGLNSDTYRGDKEIEDDDVLPDVLHQLPENFWDRLTCPVSASRQGEGNGFTFEKVFPDWIENDLVVLPGRNGKHAIEAVVTEKTKGETSVRILTDYITANKIWGINARNQLQNFAMNLLMDPNIDIVSLAGPAGTGKTLLTLAAALEQAVELRHFSEIIVTRATVPMGEDIGFLPGTEEEKMGPWMGALRDNLDFLTNTSEHALHKDGEMIPRTKEWGQKASSDLLSQWIKIKSLSFMRGRSFVNKFFIIDEAQNLTQKQIKSLITRAGQGTKIVLLGNVNQIDTPYLSASDCGLVRTVHGFRNHFKHAGYVLLEKGERSRLAEAGNEYL
jgi:PhoH-like ATPase